MATPPIDRVAMGFVLSPLSPLLPTVNFLPSYKFHCPPMICWLIRELMTTPETTYINQDVPTDFYSVEYSRLPIIAMLVDRGCSDTDGGEVYPTYSIKFMGANKIFCSFPP